MKTLLTQNFFERPTLTVAQELLGKFLVRRNGDFETALMICEVEAYDGFEDRASHAYRGKTARTRVMFGPAGRWYVYFVYGMYWMLNIVTGPADYPAAILIRAAGELDSPGKLTKKLGIDKNFNDKTALPKNGLWIEDRSDAPSFTFRKTARIGVAYAGAEWSKKPYRFVIN